MFRLSGIGPAKSPDSRQEPQTESSQAVPAQKSTAPETAPPLKPFSNKASHMPSKPVTPPNYHPAIPRRNPDIPNSVRPTSPVESQTPNENKLVVGKEIKLSGAISTCECLVVEGEVTADLAEAKMLIVSPGGTFTGTARVENAEVSGLFDGEMHVSDTVTVKKGGIVKGTITYVNMIMDRGSVVEGQLTPTKRQGAPIKGKIADPSPTGES